MAGNADGTLTINVKISPEADWLLRQAIYWWQHTFNKAHIYQLSEKVTMVQTGNVLTCVPAGQQ